MKKLYLHGPQSSHRPKALMDKVRGDESLFKYIDIAIDDAPAIRFDNIASDELHTILRDAEKSNALLVGFDIGLLTAYAQEKLGIRFERTVDLKNYLRALSLADNSENAVTLTGEEHPINAIRTLHSRMLEDKRHPWLERYLANRTLQENLKGINIDINNAQNLLKQLQLEREGILVEICGEFSDFDTSQLNSQPTVDTFCLGLSSSRLAAFLEKRHRYLSLASAIHTVDKLANGDARIYFPLKYFGAHTGRHSPSGMDSGRVNIHGLPSRRDHHTSPLALEIRTLLIPNDDNSWISCDSSNIEPRVLAFLANDQTMLSLFAKGTDVYVEFAKHLFPGEVIEKDGKNGHYRDLAKEAVIALGYGMGPDTFRKRVLAKYPSMDPALIDRTYRLFTNQFPEIRRFRMRLFKAFRNVFEDGKTRRVAKVFIKRQQWGHVKQPSIDVMLPTWRSLLYHTVVKHRSIRGEDIVTIFKYAPHLRLGAKQQDREEIRMTTLVNNVCQAVARDILAAQQYEIEQNPELRVVFSVHDELVVACPKCNCEGPASPASASSSVSGESIPCAHTTKGAHGAGDDVELTQDNDSTIRDEESHKAGDSHKAEGDGDAAGHHTPSCPWIAGGAKVAAAMSTVPTWLTKLKGLPLACEVNNRVRKHWGK